MYRACADQSARSRKPHWEINRTALFRVSTRLAHAFTLSGSRIKKFQCSSGGCCAGHVQPRFNLPGLERCAGNAACQVTHGAATPRSACNVARRTCSWRETRPVEETREKRRNNSETMYSMLFVPACIVVNYLAIHLLLLFIRPGTREAGTQFLPRAAAVKKTSHYRLPSWVGWTLFQMLLRPIKASSRCCLLGQMMFQLRQSPVLVYAVWYLFCPLLAHFFRLCNFAAHLSLFLSGRLATSPRTMATETITPTKPNIGVYTNPKHDLWLADATPTVEDVQKGVGLKPGEVTVEIKSTGICGYVFVSYVRDMANANSNLLPAQPAPMSISGTPDVSVL